METATGRWTGRSLANPGVVISIDDAARMLAAPKAFVLHLIDRGVLQDAPPGSRFSIVGASLVAYMQFTHKRLPSTDIVERGAGVLETVGRRTTTAAG